MPAATPFLEALQHLRSKKLLPTSMNSSQLATLDAAVRRQSLLSAETLATEYLDRIKSVVESILNPVQEVREGMDQTVTVGFNPATAREALRNLNAELGYAPSDAIAGTIKDLSSDARINLVVKTNTELAQGAGAYIQQNADPDVVDEWPALELVRFEDRNEPRDWEQRWRIAAAVAGDVAGAKMLEMEGRMIALKSSGIWQALGDGAGGYLDTLSNPYPPFAFNSGMWTEEVSRGECEDLGLLQPGERVAPAPFDLASLFSISAAA